jgi:glycerophosphoryl diester phosphodiesterase
LIKNRLQYLEGNKSPKEVKQIILMALIIIILFFKNIQNGLKKPKKTILFLNAWTVNEASDMDWIIESSLII